MEELNHRNNRESKLKGGVVYEDLEVPDWFREEWQAYLRQLERIERLTGFHWPPEHLEPQPNCVPAAGDIRLAFQDEVCRLVVVRNVDSDSHTASVALISNDTYMAGGTDVIMPAERTGLPFTCLIESDVVGPVNWDQLSQQVGRLLPDDVQGLLEVEKTGIPAVPHARRGLPLSGPEDPRWDYKLKEAEDMSVLFQLALSKLLL